MTETTESLFASRRCAWCGTPDDGWSEAHLLVTETGLSFCSHTCLENFECEQERPFQIVSETGTQAEKESDPTRVVVLVESDSLDGGYVATIPGLPG